jgi:hypothetical protein
MRCVHCGMDNPETVIYCQHCGWRVAGTQRHIGASSFPQHAPPVDSHLPMRPSRKDSSLPVVSQQAHRTRGKQVWRLRWVVLALLIVGVGLAWVVATSPQSLASASQTLLTYCDALKRGEYHQAYEHWTSIARQRISEADFAYSYQSRGGMSTCRMSNVSVDGVSARGTMSYTFVDGSGETAMVLLVMEQGTWKIQSQTSLSGSSGSLRSGRR